jgi:uncharacterized protein YciI
VADNDPYTSAGMFESVQILPWRVGVGDRLTLPLFALHCLDKPGTEDLRQATRPAHLAFVRSRADYGSGPI